MNKEEPYIAIKQSELLRLVNNGKTLRDEYKIAALTGILCADHYYGKHAGKSIEEHCQIASQYADAMMKQREIKE